MGFPYGDGLYGRGLYSRRPDWWRGKDCAGEGWSSVVCPPPAWTEIVPPPPRDPLQPWRPVTPTRQRGFQPPSPRHG